MHRADQPTETPPAADAAGDRASRSPISVAILAGIACVPIVVAVGFLTDPAMRGTGATAVPGDISALALRGEFDAGQRPAPPARAGY